MDEVLKSDIHYQEHTGVLTHKLTQPTERLILDRNADLRRSPGAIRDLGQNEEGGAWGRMVASIPFIIFEQAKRDGFDLACKDQEIAGREMNRFLQTPAGRACMVQGD
ncbi:MAG: hypothetical protein DRQ35_00965 [Gammaproteobacteria bacterium]|nr:MAG: hypothetical protein DRQ35_00965 [Gammaproteobacteria bacterium]